MSLITATHAGQGWRHCLVHSGARQCQTTAATPEISDRRDDAYGPSEQPYDGNASPRNRAGATPNAANRGNEMPSNYNLTVEIDAIYNRMLITVCPTRSTSRLPPRSSPIRSRSRGAAPSRHCPGAGDVSPDVARDRPGRGRAALCRGVRRRPAPARGQGRLRAAAGRPTAG